MTKILSFHLRRQLLHIPPGLRCFARSSIEKLRAEEKELADTSSGSSQGANVDRTANDSAANDRSHPTARKQP